MKITNNQNPKQIQVEMTEAELVFLRWLVDNTVGERQISKGICSATMKYSLLLPKRLDSCDCIESEDVEEFIAQNFVS